MEHSQVGNGLGRMTMKSILRMGKTSGKFIPVQDEMKLMLQSFDAQSYLENPSLDILNELSDFQTSMYQKPENQPKCTWVHGVFQNQNIFIAAMCVTQPKCKQESALITFFDNMRPTASSDVFGTSIYEDTTSFSLICFNSIGHGFTRKAFEGWNENN